MNFYTQKERELTFLYYQGVLKWDQVKFDLLPLSAQIMHMEKLKAYYPTACQKCNKLDECNFVRIGQKCCQHCGFECSSVPIVALPEIDEIKSRIWILCNKDLGWVNKNKPTTESWLGIWEMYLKAREL